LFPDIALKKGMDLVEIYKLLKGVQFEEKVDRRKLRPSKKLTVADYIEEIKSFKPKNLKIE
jgi:hypothetical protein